jgi:hypothetical protein
MLQLFKLIRLVKSTNSWLRFKGALNFLVAVKIDEEKEKEKQKQKQKEKEEEKEEEEECVPP